MFRASRVVPLLLLVAVVAVLLAGCGGGGVTGAKVETGLRQYISTLTPGPPPFPVGAGPPQVEHDSCWDRHVTTKGGQVYKAHNAGAYLLEGLKVWSCVVTFRSSLTLPVDVALNGSEVVGVWEKAARDPRPTTVYEGGPKQPKP